MTRIPSYPPIPAVAPVEFETDPQTGPVVEASGQSAAVDVVAKLAEELAAGRITGDEAVQRLMDDVMGMEMVVAAPESFQAEIREVLAAMLETDPHLSSLDRNLGASQPRVTR